MILKRLKRHGWRDLIVVYQELVERDGYTRSYGGFKRVVRRLREEPIKKRRKRKSKPYAKAIYPGQKDGRKQSAVYQLIDALTDCKLYIHTNDLTILYTHVIIC